MRLAVSNMRQVVLTNSTTDTSVLSLLARLAHFGYVWLHQPSLFARNLCAQLICICYISDVQCGRKPLYSKTSLTHQIEKFFTRTTTNCMPKNGRWRAHAFGGVFGSGFGNKNNSLQTAICFWANTWIKHINLTRTPYLTLTVEHYKTIAQGTSKIGLAVIELSVHCDRELWYCNQD